MHIYQIIWCHIKEVGSFLSCLGSDVSSIPDLYMARYPQPHFSKGLQITAQTEVDMEAKEFQYFET
jgi:hypothetical protein